jgi:alpha-amylase/alpha-mannosidase (GH57 family)
VRSRAPASGERYVCIHGHFYQPPRENPWLESVEREDSAYPYHDWNERILAECYAPNAASRRLGQDERIARIVNNYARISFNVGPTLLAWMERRAPDTYAAILEADASSRRRFSGHGSAMAQGYNHVILPLANARDRETQVSWGLQDFQHRFRRAPEGMWLPEAAVDLATLEALAARGVAFTLLSPRQAGAVRPIGDGPWERVDGGRVDPSRAYVLRLPSGRTIALFFYDGPVSQAVAFERLLDSGVGFARRLASGLSDARTWPQLMHVATDGESYGHHHRFGDMALAHALYVIKHDKLATLTNYGEFLARHPPTHEVQILEDTSWSCAHGVERWRADCGCSSGGRPGWTQRWRAPLREALDWLRDRIAPRFEDEGAALFHDPWAARDAYVRVVLDRSRASVDAFLDEHARGDRSHDAVVRRLKLLEAQRHAMLMYTSCGWFFDDVGGIETVQIILYAGRAAQLAREALGLELEAGLLERLAKAKSNAPQHGDGAALYQKHVRPAALDLARVGAHYAVSSLFSEYPDEATIHCYEAKSEAREVLESGRMKLGLGRARVRSLVTLEEESIAYAALHFGDHNVAGGVREGGTPEAHAALARELAEAFLRADVPAVIRLFDRHFGDRTFSVRSLFRDEQRALVKSLLAGSLGEADAAYRAIYERNAPVMRFLADLGVPVPRSLQVAAERALCDELEDLFEREGKLDAARARQLLAEARERKIELDATTLEFAFRGRLTRAARAFVAATDDAAALAELESAVGLLPSIPFQIDLWNVQNVFYSLLRGALGDHRARVAAGDVSARDWVERVVRLGQALRVRVE